MAKNTRKEEIQITWSTNYADAVNKINQVKDSVSDNNQKLKELDNLQKKLENQFKSFEKALEDTNDAVKDSESANDELMAVIKSLDETIKRLDSSLEKLESNVASNTATTDKLNKSLKQTTTDLKQADSATDALADSTADLASANDNLSTSTIESNSTAVEQSILFEKLDSVTGGYASKIRDLVGQNGKFSEKLRGNAKDFEAMSKASKAGTVAVNGAKLAMKGLLVGAGIGILLIAIEQIVANWDKITKSVEYLFNPSAKLKDLELEKLEAQKNQVEEIDGQTERLKRQGKTEEEIAKMKLTAQNNRIEALKKEIEIKRKDEADNLSWWEEVQALGMMYYGVVLKVASGYVLAYEKASDFFKEVASLGDYEAPEGDRLSDTLNQKANDAFNWRENRKKENAKNYEDSDEIKELLAELDKAEEIQAGMLNRMDANAKARSDKQRAINEQERKELLAHQAELTKLIEAYELDIQKINAKSIRENREADWTRNTTEIENKRNESLDKLSKAYSKNSKEYQENFKIINELHDKQIEKIQTEKDLFDEQTKSFEEFSKSLKDSGLSIDSQVESVEKFLETISDADLKDEYSRLLGIDSLREAKDYMSQFAEEITLKDFEINDDQTISNNQNKLDANLAYNISLLEQEERFAMLRAEALGVSEEERKKIVEKYAKEKKEVEQSYNQASKDLNIKGANQISEYATLASEGISNLGSLMSDSFETNKSFAIADSVISTFLAINNTMASMSKENPYLAIATSIAMGISGFANVMSIMNTTPENAGSQSAPTATNLDAVSAQPNVSFIQSGESQLAQTINNQNQEAQPLKAYVSEKDITSAQELARNRRNNSSL